MSLHVAPCTIAEIEAAPNLPEIADEFTAESLLPGLPRTPPNWAAYRALEAANLLHPFGAWVDGLLVGFVGVLLGPAIPVATTERIFVLKAHRKTGAGLKLLKAAEEKARDLGSPGLQIVARSGGDLAQVLTRKGYLESNIVFVKLLVAA